MRNMFLALGGLVLLSGCASTRTENSIQQRTQNGVADAALQPLQDFGLMRDSIPSVLASITDPYAAPTGPGCVWIAYEVNQLTSVLGPDADVIKANAPENWQTQGADAASSAAVSAARGAATGWIPARGIVRSLTGADKSERKYLGAFEAGRLRRAYLKGLGEGQGCQPPAAPIPLMSRPQPAAASPSPTPR